jgi:hypothetical protein
VENSIFHPAAYIKPLYTAIGITTKHTAVFISIWTEINFNTGVF